MKSHGRVEPGDFERWIGHCLDQSEENRLKSWEIGATIPVRSQEVIDWLPQHGFVAISWHIHGGFCAVSGIWGLYLQKVNDHLKTLGNSSVQVGEDWRGKVWWSLTDSFWTQILAPSIMYIIYLFGAASIISILNLNLKHLWKYKYRPKYISINSLLNELMWSRILWVY